MNWRILSLVFGWMLPIICQAETPWKLQLRHQVETHEGSNRYHRLLSDAEWQPTETAIIVCDMWDSHHCYRAVQRENEFAPRLNDLLNAARSSGATIVHAPSDCMAAYTQHPARLRAIGIPAANDYPDEIADWCYKIPNEEKGRYPIDQSDGGEDDTPEEHAKWEKALISDGRNPRAPWKKQIDLLEIDSDQDFVTDQGKEVWNILRNKNIKHVILAGVHTNMCVLGRPFGLRRMASAGMSVALIRDMTDTMYNPAAWPYVSHFTGTDLIIDHVERYVCPTISSNQFIGGDEFRFAADTRPHLAVVINEPEYETIRTLPLYLDDRIRSDYRISMFYGSQTAENEFPGIEQIQSADALLLSVRRRTPPTDQLNQFRQFVDNGKPVIGIRTANHAFSLRTGDIPDGGSDWPTWDAEVFGGSYTNHHGNGLVNIIEVPADQVRHPILRGISLEPFVAGDSLYMVSPLAKGTEVLMTGTVSGKPVEPVAWTYQRKNGGKSFYTSLGAPADFEHPSFQQLLRNAIQWATNE